MTGRRTWDKEFFEKKAKERAEKGDGDNEEDEKNKSKSTVVREEFRPADEEAIGPMGSQRAFLRQREGKVDVIEDKVGKKEVINPLDIEGNKAGFWCEVCKCLLKDSSSYLDHINGKKHQRALGFSMRVERADVSTVKNRLEELKRKIGGPSSNKHDNNDLSEYDRELREKEEFKRRRKEEKQQEKNKKVSDRIHEEEDDDEYDNGNDDIAALMGFSGFSKGSK